MAPSQPAILTPTILTPNQQVRAPTPQSPSTPISQIHQVINTNTTVIHGGVREVTKSSQTIEQSVTPLNYDEVSSTHQSIAGVAKTPSNLSTTPAKIAYRQEEMLKNGLRYSHTPTDRALQELRMERSESSCDVDMEESSFVSRKNEKHFFNADNETSYNSTTMKLRESTEKMRKY